MSLYVRYSSPLSSGGGGTPITVGAYDSQIPSSNGAVILGSTIYFQSASATVPGMVNIGAQSFAGVKTFLSAPILSSLSASQLVATNGSNQLVSQATGNLTEATSSVLTITGGTGSVIGSGTSIQVKQAGASQSGYLSSADWNTFNNKQPAITPGTTSQYYRGDLTFQTLNPFAVTWSPNIIGSPATLTDLGQVVSHLWSAGATDGAILTNNGDGTVNITGSTTMLRQPLLVSSITRSGTTATLTTSVNHGYNAGEFVSVYGATQSQYNGFFEIESVPALNQLTYIVAGSPATPATGTIYVVNQHSPIFTTAVPAITNLALTDHFTNYIYADWNAGSPIFKVTLNAETDINGLSSALIWTVAREGTSLFSLDARESIVDTANKIDDFIHEVAPFAHVIGGTALSAVGTRQIAVSAGTFYYGLNEVPHPAFDTSAGGTFTTAYVTSGVWTYTAGQTTISNTQYNNTSTGLASLTVGNYGVHWLYIVNNDPSILMVVYGQGDYASLADARAAAAPTLSNAMAGVSALIGRIVIKQGASSFTDLSSAFQPVLPTSPLTLDGLADVNVPNPGVNDRLIWNGAQWTNGPPSTSSAGAGVNFYHASPTILATGTNNANFEATLSQTPVTTTEQTIATAVNNTTLLNSAFRSSAAMGRTQFDAGLWDFNIYAGVSNAGTRTISEYIYQVIPSTTAAITVTTTGTGTTRTATASGDAPFVSGDASATVTVGGYLETPQGLFKITAFTSATVVSIATPTTYVNETGVNFYKWSNLFGSTSSNITGVTPAYQQMSFTSVQNSFTVATTDYMGAILFVTSNNNTTITTVYNGTSHNSFITTPFAILHNQLPGLQGGTSGQYYHLTNADYTNVINATSANTANAIVKRDVAGGFSAATVSAKEVDLVGASSGTIAIKPQAVAGTYNFNLPTSAGSAGQVLTSQGGGSNAMTWTNPTPTFTAPTQQIFTSGSGTYTKPANVLYLRVRMVGGGSGAGPAGAGGTGSAAGSGGDTTFIGSLTSLTASGSVSSGSVPGAPIASPGGTTTVTGNFSGIALTGAAGADAMYTNNNGYILGSNGGSSPFGGAGMGNYTSGYSTSHINAVANTGSGGGGSGIAAANANWGGAGGGAGGYIDGFITSPEATYSYGVGAGGAGGTGTFAGGNGGSGILIVEEFYQ